MTQKHIADERFSLWSRFTLWRIKLYRQNMRWLVDHSRLILSCEGRHCGFDEADSKAWIESIDEKEEHMWKFPQEVIAAWGINEDDDFFFEMRSFLGIRFSILRLPYRDANGNIV